MPRSLFFYATKVFWRCKIEIEFTDDRITPSAGSIFLSTIADKLGLPNQLKTAIKLKRRERGASDAEMLLSLIYSLAQQGDGAILDVDRLGQDEARQKLLFPRYTFILVSRDDLPLAEVVRRHRGKQGQENALKGTLIHLDLHHPPCGAFNANRAFYAAGQIAQILLVALQMKFLPFEARKHGIRTIIRDMVRVAGKLVCHARKWKLLFAKSALRLHWLSYAADRLVMTG